MKRFLMLAPWVAVGISIIGLTSAGSATARVTQSAGIHHGTVHVINLRKTYEARLGHATVSQIAGIAYAQGDVPPPGTTGRGGNNCAEPFCPVSYQGGAVQQNPHVYLLLWGPDWLTDPGQEATANYLQSFYSGLGVESGPSPDNWSTITSQYSGTSGPPTFGNSVLVGTYYDVNPPPGGTTPAQFAAEADSFAQGIADLSDAQIVIATQSGTCPEYFAAPSCPNPGNECSYHANSNEPFTNLPYLLDAGSLCGEDAVNPGGTDDGFSIVGGHEYAESITDPVPFTGWEDPLDNQIFPEIADKCAWSSLSDVTLSTGSFAMQPLWSNSANGGSGACVMSSLPGTDTVTVAPPGSQSTYQRSRLSLQMIGTSSAGYKLTWTSKGLPSGLTINPSTGIISGQVTAPPGTYPVSVTATDAAMHSGTASFDWAVNADVGTIITNQASGTCLNDLQSSINPGNHVVVWGCRDGPAEMFTHPHNPGELEVLGQCVTDPNHGGKGALLVVDPCASDLNQEWYHNSKHEYVVEKNLMCLTDPHGTTVNGAPAKVEPCTDAKDQRWSGT